MKNIIYIVTLLFLTSTLTSCSTVPVKVTPSPVMAPGPVMTGIQPSYGAVHIVEHGQTLWRISKMYGVDINDIGRANNLKEPWTLETGQRLLIPKAVIKQPAIPLYPTSRWQYIIIHHSATDEGSARSLSFLHLRRGFSRGLGYDFVIDNGTKGKSDGQIEISRRWLKQEVGAHCQASEMNHKGIGICLVGNFSKERVSGAQMDSLVYLINTLMKYYGIPIDHVMGHGQVLDAKTECPGKYFPWEEFRARLRNGNS